MVSLPLRDAGDLGAVVVRVGAVAADALELADALGVEADLEIRDDALLLPPPVVAVGLQSHPLGLPQVAREEPKLRHRKRRM